MSRFKHNLSHYKLTSGDMGKLIPAGCVEVLPGDTFSHSTSVLLRCSELVSPVMHPCIVRIHHWFVPHRLVWTDAGGANTGFEAFITGGPDGTAAPTFPTITFNNAASGSLADYFDVPTGIASNRAVSALPFRAYALTFNEFYRDQDLVTALTIDKTDGADTTTNTTLQSIAWEKDRYTTARTSTQKGTAVTLPLGSTAPVVTTGTDIRVSSSSVTNRTVQIQQTTNDLIAGGAAAGADANMFWGDATGLQVDLTGATAADINDIRMAFAIQRYKENRLRYGSRYTEYLAYLGIRSSDSRLQRPEYLGGGKQTIQFSEVLQTGPGGSFNPGDGVGHLTGHGIAAARSNRYLRFFEEHGYVITLLSIRPKSLYGNGIPKHLLRTTKEDFWQKELQHVGQAEIYNKEVYSGDTGPDDVFGYQDRYDEYRREESRISGNFRSSPLDGWHLARLFAGDVTLNGSFVTCDPAESRIFQSTASDTLKLMVYHRIGARRLVAPVGTSNIF